VTNNFHALVLVMVLRYVLIYNMSSLRLVERKHPKYTFRCLF